jgi:hypothetical protein
VTRDTFQVVGDSLSGHGLSFDVAPLVAPAQKIDSAERGKRLAEIAETAYRDGRASALLSRDDRFDLHCAVDVLRGLAVVVGPTPTSDRHRRAADILARLLQEQEGSS